MGGDRHYTQAEFEGALRALRRSREYIGTVNEIFDRIQGEELSKAILIHLVTTSPLSPEDKDLVLATWGLLTGYTNIESLTKRREEYVRGAGYNGKKDQNDLFTRQHLPQGELDDLVGKLMKKENPAYAKIAKQYMKLVNDRNEVDTFINSAKADHIDHNHRAIIPSASYHASVTLASGNYGLRNLEFIGREDILEALFNNYFIEEKPIQLQVLYGMAGVGKTTIAIEYIYRNRSFYSLVWRLDASNEENLINGCSELLKLIDKNFSKAVGNTAVINSFINYMEEQSNWLIFFDNADLLFEDSIIASKLRACIPKSKGHILIATRIARDVEWAFVHRVELFDMTTSVAYLVNKTKQPEDEYTRTLAERLVYLPLALTYAGSYIRQHTDYKGYLELWDKRGLEVWDQKDGQYADRTVRQAFDITLDKIKENLPDENTKLLLNLLNLCAHFEAEYFPVDAYIDYMSPLSYLVQEDYKESVLSKRTHGRIIPHWEDGKYHHTQYIVLDDDTYEERWVDGPNQGEIVLPDPKEVEMNLLVSKLQDDLARHDLVRRVTQYSLAEYDNGKFRMHPLLRQIIRDEMDDITGWNDFKMHRSFGVISEVLELSGDKEATLASTRKFLIDSLKDMQEDISYHPFEHKNTKYPLFIETEEADTHFF